jgi:hypothetical protein
MEMTKGNKPGHVVLEVNWDRSCPVSCVNAYACAYIIAYSDGPIIITVFFGHIILWMDAISVQIPGLHI